MAVYGWRARIGHITPGLGGSVAEPALWKMAPEGVAIYTSWVGTKMEGMTFETDDLGIVHPLLPFLPEAKGKDLQERLGHAVLEKLEEVVEQLAMMCDIIVFNCTTESVALGVDYDEETVKRIEAAAKLPGITKNILGMTTGRAICAAMSRMGVKKLVMVSPYYPETNELHKAFYEAKAGARIINMKACCLNHDQYLMTAWEPSDWYKAAKSVWMPEADGIIIPCANIRSVEAIEALEADLNTVVFTANQCVLWACLDKLGVKVSIQGYGKLLREKLVS